MDESSKVSMEIAVDRELADAARAVGLDLEEEFERALRRKLG